VLGGGRGRIPIRHTTCNSGHFKHTNNPEVCTSFVFIVKIGFWVWVLGSVLYPKPKPKTQKFLYPNPKPKPKTKKYLYPNPKPKSKKFLGTNV
jgi:hypothetical protein